MPEPLRSIFDFQAGDDRLILQTFDKIGKGVKGLRDHATSLAKIGTLPDLIVGKGQDQEKTKRVLSDYEKQLSKIKKAFNEQRDSFLRMTREMSTSNARPEYLTGLQGSIDEAKRKMAALKGQYQDLMNTQPSMGGGMGGFGMSPTAPFRSIAMPLGQIGGYDSATGQLAQSLQMIGDLGDSAQMMGSDLEGAIASISDFTDTIKMARQQGGGLKGTLSGVVSGIGEFNVIGGLLAVNMVAWGAVFNKLGEQAQAAREDVDRYADAIDRQQNLQHQVNQAIKTGDIEGASQALEDAYQQWQDTAEKEAKLKEKQAGIQRQYNELGGALNPGERNRLGAAGQEVQTQLDNLMQDYEQANEAIQMWGDSIEKVEQQARQNRLDDAFKATTSLLAQMADTVDSTNKQMSDFIEESNFQRQRELQQRTRADQRAASEQQDALDQIETDGMDRRKEINDSALKDIDKSWKEFDKDRVKAVAALGKALSSVDKDEEERIADVNKNYMKDRLKSTEQHLKELAKAENDYDKQRLRRTQDMYAELQDAEFANDVIRFMQAEDRAQTDLKRMAEDHADQKKESDQAFKEDQQQRREQRDDEIQQIHDDAAKRRQELKDQFAEDEAARKEQQAERIQQIQASAAEQIAEQKKQEDKARQAQIDSYEKRLAQEQDDRDYADKLAAEDRQRQLDKMEQAGQDQLDELQHQQDQQQQVIESGGQKKLSEIQFWEEQMRAAQVNSYQNALKQMQASAASYGSSFSSNYAAAGYGTTVTATAARSGSIFGNYSRIFAAEGALIDKPTLMVAGENHKPELVMPFDNSKGVPDWVWDKLGSGGRGGDVNINAPIELGNISEAAFRAEMRNLQIGIQKFLEQTQ